MLEKEGTSGIRGVANAGLNVVTGGAVSIVGAVVGAAISGVTKLFGGTPEEEKIAGREVAAQFVSEGEKRTSVNLNAPSIRAKYGFPAPTAKGEFYLWRSSGQVFAVTSYGGMVPHSSEWASRCKTVWARWTVDPATGADILKTDLAKKQRGSPSMASLGSSPLVLIGIALAFMSFKR